MLPVERLRVRSLDTDSNEVTWEVAGSSMEDALDYTFQILRSESPEGPFEPITQAFTDRYIFVDRRLPAGDKFRQIWYRLRTTRKSDENVEDSPSVCRQAEPDLIANYIRRLEQTLFTQATARLCWLFKRRTFGARCPSCWDPVSGKKARGNCLTCYQTGFLRGYLNPIEVWIQIDPASKAQQNQSQQMAQHTSTSARMTFYPNVVPGDVIVEAENKRWRVDKVTQSERLRTPIKQELLLLQINDTDIEYRLPINLETALRDIQPSPVQMFYNPTDLQSVIEDRTASAFTSFITPPIPPDALITEYGGYLLTENGNRILI